MTYFETMLLPMQNLFHCLTRQMLTTNLPFSLRGKGEFERAKAQKARSLGVLARLKSPFPIKRLQRIRAYRIAQTPPSGGRLNLVKQRQCEKSGGGISF